ILDIAGEFDRPDAAYLAPQAARNTWYPQSFMAETTANEPWLSSALAAVDRTVNRVTAAGIPHDRTVLLGFSQGACLASEYVARNARRYGGLVVLSGGLIGPPGTPRDYEGSLADTPVFIGCSDRDPHIPIERVHETTRVLTDLGADVQEEIYPNMGHGVSPEELDHDVALVDAVSGID
ncbi:MAG: dienelactone hydrolase family protein, partial [Halobacteriales archaeon]|nr:dienelactone hydrolase family protein [Halobacteriales archaeon]